MGHSKKKKNKQTNHKAKSDSEDIRASWNEMSRKETFQDLGFCSCDQCRSSEPSDSAALPCWYSKKETTAMQVKAAFQQAIKSPLSEMKTLSILGFNHLTQNNHIGYHSDIIHLRNISTQEVAQKLNDFSLSMELTRLLQLAKLLYVCNWKTDQASVTQAFRVQNEVLEDETINKVMNEQQYKDTLASIRNMMLSMAQQLILFAFDSDFLLRRLSLFNDTFNTTLAHSFRMGSGKFPWLESYLLNFRYLYKAIWMYHKDSTKIKASLLILPTRGKVSNKAEINVVNLLPHLSKQESCDVCNTSIIKNQILYPIEFALSRNESFFPREVMMRKDSCQTVGMTCSLECLVKNERSKSDALDLVISLVEDLEKEGKIMKLKSSNKNTLSEKYLKELSSKMALIFTPRLKHLAWLYIQYSFDLILEPIVEKELDVGDSFLDKVDKTLSKRGYDTLMETLSEASEMVAHNSHPEDYFKDHFNISVKSIKYKCTLGADEAQYRKSLSEKPVQLDESQNSIRVTLIWKTKWGKVLPFAEKDHFISIEVADIPSFSEFNTTTQGKTFKALEFAFEKQESLIFPVTNKFFSYSDYVKGIKFGVFDPKGNGGKHLHKLKLLLKEYDCLLFANEFNYEVNHCQGGFFYLCPESDAVIGILLVDFYQYLMEDYGLNNLALDYNRYFKHNFSLSPEICKSYDDTPPEARGFRFNRVTQDYTFRRAVLFFFRLVLMRHQISKLEAQGFIPSWPARDGGYPHIKAIKHIFVFKMKNHLKGSFTLCFIDWSIGNYDLCELKMIEMLKLRLKFKIVSDLSILPKELQRDLDPDCTLTNVKVPKRYKKDALTSYLFFCEKPWILFEHDIYVTFINIQININSKEKRGRFLAPCDLQLDRILEFLEGNDEFVSEPLKITYSYNHSIDSVIPHKFRERFKLQYKPGQIMVKDFKDKFGDRMDCIMVKVIKAEKKEKPPFKTNQADPFSLSVVNDYKCSLQEPQLLWNGTINICVNKMPSFDYQVRGWMVTHSSSDNLKLSLGPILRSWRKEMFCVVVDDKPFMDSVKKSSIFEGDKCIRVKVIESPMWHESGIVNKSLVELLRDAAYLSVIPYKCENAGYWSFAKLTCIDGICIEFPSNSDLAHYVMDTFPFLVELLPTSVCPSEFIFGMDPPRFVKAVLGGRLADSAVFSLATSTIKDKQIVPKPSKDEKNVSNFNGSHVFFLVEKYIFPLEKCLICQEFSLELFMDTVEKPQFLKHLSDLAILCVSGPLKAVLKLFKLECWNELAERSFIINLKKSEQAQYFSSTAKILKHAAMTSTIKKSSKSRVFQEFIKFYKAKYVKCRNVKFDWNNVDQALLTPNLESGDVKEEKEERRSKAVEVCPHSLVSVLKFDEDVYMATVDYVDAFGKKLHDGFLKEEMKRTNPVDMCTYCKKEGFDLSKCGNCVAFTYCSEKCFVNDRNHQRECKEVQERRILELINHVKKLPIKK